MRRLAVLPLLCLLSAPALADEVKRSLDEVDVGDYKLLGLHLPLGNVLLESGDRVPADLRRDYLRTLVTRTDRVPSARLNAIYQEMGQQAIFRESPRQ